MTRVRRFYSTVRTSLFSTRYSRRATFSTQTSSLANLSDHFIRPQQDRAIPTGKGILDWSGDKWNVDELVPRCVSSDDSVDKEGEPTHLSPQELDDAWNLLSELQDPQPILKARDPKPANNLNPSKTVYTPRSAPTSPQTTASKQSLHPKPPVVSLVPPPEYPSLEWRTRAKSQVKHDYTQLSLPDTYKENRCFIQPPRTPSRDDEAEAWLWIEETTKPTLSKAQVLSQARTVQLDPYASEASRYVKSWSSVMELEREKETITAMKRLYEIRRKSGNRYNPSGKSLVDLVVSQVPAPEFVKPTHKNDIYLRVEKADEGELELCSFRNGDYLLLSAEPETNPDNEDSTAIESMPKVFSRDAFVTCRLVLKRTYHLILRLETSDAGLDAQTYRLDYGWDGTSFDRTSAAVQAMEDDPDSLRKTLSPKEIERSNTKITGSSLRRPLLFAGDTEALKSQDNKSEIQDSTFHLFTRDQRINSWAKRHLRYPALKMPGDPDLGHLNEPQTRAIAMAISSPLSLIQGPPGTGKTQTIIQMLVLLKIHFQVPQPIAVCAPTHVSVDNLVQGFIRAGLKPVRCGEHLKVDPEVAPFSLETLEAKHALTPGIETKTLRLESLTKDLDAIEKRWRNYKPSGTSNTKSTNSKQAKVIEVLKNEYKKLSFEIYMLKRRRQKQIISSADVVCSTCLGAGSSNLEAAEFVSVIIDEAAMCHEPTTLVPLTKGSAHTVLVGDHKQLPAITLSPAAEARGYGTSLFERLQTQDDVPSILLHKQYRMHPTISAFPNIEFYHHALSDAIEAESLKPVYFHHDLFLEPHQRSKAVCFVTHNHSETKVEKTLMNQKEAETVLSILRDLLRSNPGLSGREIGIIAPYRGQVSLLQSLQRQPQKASLIRDLEHTYRNEVEINTVDGFQGREKSVIILSCVRGNDQGQIGFLADLRRFNVAATRAKHKFVVVGHLDTLQHANVSRYLQSGGHYNAEAWRRWVRWTQTEGLMIDSERFRGK